MDASGVAATPAWVRDAVFYEIFPDRFARSPRVVVPGDLEPWEARPTQHGFKGGNLPGIAEHLDHLEDLGVTAIYLTPIFASAANHRYHTYDYHRVDPLLGGDRGLSELLDAAHARGMRVILDGVFNHAGRGFWPFHHVLENGIASPYTGWFHLDRARLRAGRRLSAYPDAAGDRRLDPAWGARHRGGRFSLRELGYRAWWDLPALPKLNVDNPNVRSFLFEVAEHWTRQGIDGWRFDVPEEISPDFWIEMANRISAVNPDAYLVGEVWRVAPEWVAPRGPFHGLMNYALAWPLIGFAAGAGLDAGVVGEQADMRAHVRPTTGAAFLRAVADLMAAYPAQASTAHLNLLGSHDTPRLRAVCGGDPAAVRLAFLLLLSLPGSPCIYYGDEIGLTGGADPDCRAAVPWQRDAWDAGTLELVRAAIHLRTRTRALRGGDFTPLVATGSACAYRRGAGRGAVWVVANPGTALVELDLADLPSGAQTALATGAPPGLSRGSDVTRVRVPGRSGAILLHRPGG